ncbi:ABZJ_00895 family protein [Acinetobacter larvae]|uniref:Uncharacterized protein n=1 Tax=Acinetobacter larvae TaxID=1789224 RepID=A0A1B2M314_9GAMM|nr:ABZJ_00895 family protein [Acinetobacter larvae]AOA59590.1 hypothetical protein BFG52_15380 [Acinetobacter larvae]
MVAIKKYILFFSLVYAGLCFIFFAITNFIDLPNTVASIVTISVAAIMTSTKFVQEQKRLPDQSEKNKLIWGCFIASILWSTAIILVFLSFSDEKALIMELLDEILNVIPLWFLALSIIISLIIQYGILRLSFGLFAHRTLKNLK